MWLYSVSMTASTAFFSFTVDRSFRKQSRFFFKSNGEFHCIVYRFDMSHGGQFFPFPEKKLGFGKSPDVVAYLFPLKLFRARRATRFFISLKIFSCSRSLLASVVNRY